VHISANSFAYKFLGAGSTDTEESDLLSASQASNSVVQAHSIWRYGAEPSVGYSMIHRTIGALPHSNRDDSNPW
jgi:hypothetical protein